MSVARRMLSGRHRVAVFQTDRPFIFRCSAAAGGGEIISPRGRFEHLPFDVLVTTTRRKR